MKFLLLGAGCAIHTQRWANGLVQAGAHVVCASQHDFIADGWDTRVRRARLPHSGMKGYFLNARAVARLCAEERCTLVNAHYATGYGLLATLSGVRPRLISVWGSDVYDFPATSPLHAMLVRRVLRSADAVASTSHAMARQVEQVIGREPLRQAVAITPFGVDTSRFHPPTALRESGPVVVGTVKTLAPKYGVDTLVEAFARLPQAHDGRPLQLRIVGDGPQRAELQGLASRLGVSERVQFAGAVPHADVPSELRRFDIFVAASRWDSESFGVAVVEASACGLPVIVSDAGGLPEVVRHDRTGLIVTRDDPAALALALQRMVADEALRHRLGAAGRAWVQREYEWAACVQRMLAVYAEVLRHRHGAQARQRGEVL